MKKALPLLVLFFITLVGCGDVTDTSLEMKDTNSENATHEQNETLSFDEEFLRDIQDIYNSSDNPKSVLNKVKWDFDKLQDQEVKDSVLKLFNDSVLKMLENQEGIKLLLNFFDYDSNQLIFEEYLYDDVKQKVITEVNPINAILEKENLTMQTQKEYNEHINQYSSRFNVANWLSDNNIESDFISDHLSGLLLIKNDNTIVELTDKVKRIYQLVDEKGNVVNPEDYLEDYATKLAELNSKEHKESAEELEKEMKESKSIRIGMTTDEVLERWGEPKDINKTITKYGTSEQWVYPNFQYVYFEDGIVDTIQQ